MKYIRTKDGRINILLDTKVEWNEETFDNETRWYVNEDEQSDNNYYVEEQIVKVADTIEELIDLYVIVTEDGRHITMSVDKAVADLEDNYLRKYYFIKGDYVIYGEIWVDGELHKVAKMNKEGELGLL